jgi:hypothetical protein
MILKLTFSVNSCNNLELLLLSSSLYCIERNIISNCSRSDTVSDQSVVG